MLIRGGQDFLELTVSERSEAPQDSGDTRFVIRVRVTGINTVFSAETWAWVEIRVLAAFAEQLRVLEDRRQGSAALESMLPGELKLEVRITDSAGHVAAFGQVGHWCYTGAGAPHWSVVAFGIPFDPTELPGLVREFSGIVTG